MKKRYHTKQSLAKAYFPELPLASARRKMARWVNENPMLLEELKKNGYHPLQRQYTSAQLKIIFSVLGHP